MMKILVCDDEPNMIELFKIILKGEGYQVLTASTAEEAIESLEKEAPDILVTDISMPKAGGMHVLSTALEFDPELPVIMMTAYASTDTAIDAMKKGAYHYITKPFKVDELKLIIKKALRQRHDRRELIRLKGEILKSGKTGILGRSNKIKELLNVMKKIAPSKSNVMITGESGVGKELFARAIHDFSDRSSREFHSINCGAIPTELLESELFGHQKGSFTGAYADKQGLLELANGGTFFFDEIAETPLPIQVKLLRVIQEKEFKRIGGVKDISVDVRFLAATNKDLKDLINKGVFREDLYYRLNIITLDIPPLRERLEDIPILVSSFLEKYSEENRKDIRSISSEVMDSLEKYSWPGNVRELENVIERAVVMTNVTSNSIQMDVIPPEIRNFNVGSDKKEEIEIPDDNIGINEAVEKLEISLIKDALKKAKGSKIKAAEILKLSFRAFRYKCKKYDL